MKHEIHSPGSPEPSLTGRTSVEDLVRLSSSFDGFKRENAVRRLGMIGDPAAIPALIIRANDWVPEVRAAAYNALIRMLTLNNAAAFVASLPQLLHLQKCTRGDHTTLLRAIEDFLVREGNVDALKAAWHSENVHVARLATRLLIAKRALPSAEIITKGLAHEDIVIRAIVIDLLRELKPDEFEPAVTAALSDRYMPVRREAFQQLMSRFPDKGLVVAKSLLFDRAATVRELAVRQLSAAGEPVEDMHSSALRVSCGRAAMARCVLWGWTALNCRSRLNQVEQMLGSPLASLRRAALQALAKLSPESAAGHLEAALADLSAGVSKVAARLIRKHGVTIDVDTLIAIAKSRKELHVTYACHHVARHGSKWDWLKFVLSVYPDSNCGVPREALQREVLLWDRYFNHSGAQPDRRTRHELAELISACKSQLQRKQLESLEFTLRTC